MEFMIFWLVFASFMKTYASSYACSDNEPSCKTSPFVPKPTESPGDCITDPEEEFKIVEETLKDYCKQIIPSKTGVEVAVELTVNDVFSLDEINADFELDIFFSEIWRDPRLDFKAFQSVCITNITLNLEYLHKLWQPNICIVNSRSTEIHSSPSENVFLILYEDGRVWKNCRMKVKAPCEINLKKFPFDMQPCTLVFESYSYSSQRVGLKWFENPLSFVSTIELADFTLADWETEYNQIFYPNGLWDQVKVTFYFKRRYKFFILQAYIPTYTTIFVAWMNFWMDSSELSTRTTLSISAFLAMTFQFGSILNNLPRVSYVKAIDVWMIGGIAFLFAVLSELAAISYLQRRDRPLAIPKLSKRTKRRDFRLSHSSMNEVDIYIRKDELNCNNNDASNSAHTEAFSMTSPKNSPNISRTKLPKHQLLCGRWTPYDIDRFFLIFFPPCFFLFNIVYWGYYLWT